MHRVREKISFANVTALLALFIALGGSAYAVKKNSIGTKQLKKNAVTTIKIKDGAVTNPKIANAAVTSTKLAAGAVTQAGLGPITVYTKQGNSAGDNANSDATVNCPAGTRAIGGGARADDFANDLVWLSSRPAKSEADTAPPANGGTFNAWRTRAFNPPAGTATLNADAYVICLG